MRVRALPYLAVATAAVATSLTGCGETTMHSWTKLTTSSAPIAPAVTTTPSEPVPQAAHGGRGGIPAGERQAQSEELKRLKEEHRQRVKQEEERQREEQIKDEDEDQSER